MVQKRFPKVSDTAQERREHIIESATQLIASHGLQGVSMRAVADRAGCSRGLVEHYFSNKAALLSAANHWANETYLKRVAQAVGSLTGLAALEVRLGNLLPYTQAELDEWRVRLVFWRQASTDTAPEQEYNLAFHPVYREILADMLYAQRQGEIPVSVPILETSELVLFFVIGLGTTCLRTSQLREKRPLDRRVEMLIGLLKSGSVSALQVGDPNVEY